MPKATLGSRYGGALTLGHAEGGPFVENGHPLDVQWRPLTENSPSPGADGARYSNGMHHKPFWSEIGAPRGAKEGASELRGILLNYGGAHRGN